MLVTLVTVITGPFEFDFEDAQLNEATIRQLVWQVRGLHDSCTKRCLVCGAQALSARMVLVLAGDALLPSQQVESPAHLAWPQFSIPQFPFLWRGGAV